MIIRSRIPAFIAFIMCPLLASCGNTSAKSIEAPVVPSASQRPAVSMTPARKAGPTQTIPATSADVRAAVHRVFGDSVLVEERGQPRFVTGDFNGDGYEDLMVVVIPVRNKLAEINDQLSNWSIESPTHVYHPPKNQKVVHFPPAPKPEQVGAKETLVAVIHGFGAEGWRHPLARQAYLLRNVAGDWMSVQAPPESLIRYFGRFPSRRDVVAENRAGARGVLYWTGATYAWYGES
ncbi:MAG TPA: hypothetical protein VF011_05340 [Terriglobales bacterium]